jgi:HEAT repeat protein
VRTTASSILILALLVSLSPAWAQGAGSAASVPMDPAVRREIDRLSAADKIDKGRGFRALQAMGPKAAPAVPYLVGLLGDDSGVGLPNPPSHWEAIGWSRTGDAAAVTLIKIGEPAVAPLIKALGDGNPRVRGRALRALKGITGQNLPDDPAAWQRWWRSRKAPGPSGRAD